MNLFVVDVGNTATSCGVFTIRSKAPAPQPRSVFTLSTNELRRPKSFSRFSRRQFRRSGLLFSSFCGGLVSSVVPPIDKILKKELRALFHVEFPFVSNKTVSRVKIRYRVPSEVGADRIVNARAAIELWHGNSIVVDFGTATTFDCVTRGGNYLGGVIAPGPVISAEALYQKTAKLPMVLLENPVQILGRNTLESIQAGLYHGYRGLVKEIVSQLKKRLGLRTKVLATGGQAHWILRGLNVVDEHVPHLTLQGLYYLWMDAYGSGPD